MLPITRSSWFAISDRLIMMMMMVMKKTTHRADEISSVSVVFLPHSHRLEVPGQTVGHRNVAPRMSGMVSE